ncbi:MAG: SH3 domain-containing protein [Youngiibacter sp.]|nr:SH3 domain-containing protein [Youngiibacter sp.]
MHSKKIRNILIKATAFLVIASASAMPGAASWTGMTNGGIEAFALELQGTVTITCSALWTYSRPDWTAKVKVAYKGESFTAVEKISVAGRDMYRLSNGMYISANPLYVSFRESSQAPAPVVQASSAMAATANLNMRTGPGTGYQIIRVIPKGAQVSVSGSENGWYKVTYQGATGWASGSYLTPVQAQAPATAP